MALTDESFEGTQYRLRTGGPMPTANGFVMHTFMAESSKIVTYICKTNLPKSSEFRGQSFSETRGTTMISASFSRVGALGGNVFQGKVTYDPVYIDESNYGFNF